MTLLNTLHDNKTNATEDEKTLELVLKNKYRGYIAGYTCCAHNSNARPGPYVRDSNGQAMEDALYSQRIENLLKPLIELEEELRVTRLTEEHFNVVRLIGDIWGASMYDLYTHACPPLIEWDKLERV